MIVDAMVDPMRATATLTFEGEIDIETYDVLRDTIVGQRTDTVSSIVLDLSGVTFFDSTGIRGLLAARTALDADGVQIKLGPMSPIVEKVLEVTQILTLFPRA